MDKLTNQMLLETYGMAKELKLAKVFMQLIEYEINRRELSEEEFMFFSQIKNKKVRNNVRIEKVYRSL